MTIACRTANRSMVAMAIMLRILDNRDMSRMEPTGHRAYSRHTP